MVQKRRPPDEAVATELSGNDDLRVADTISAKLDAVAKSDTGAATIITKVARKSSDEYFQEALAFGSAGRLERAERALGAALTASPEHANVRVALVSNLVQQNRTREALGVLRDGLETTPAEPKAR